MARLFFAARLRLALVLGFVSTVGCEPPMGQPPTRGDSAEAKAPPREVPGVVYQVDAKPPLQGGRARARAGDWILRNDRLVAVIRARDGRLIDLGRVSDGRDVLHRVDTHVSDTRGRYRVYYGGARVVEISEAKTHGLELRGRVRDLDLDLAVRTTVWAPHGADYLVLQSIVTNRRAERVLRVGLGDSAYLGNTRLFLPGHGLVRHSVRHYADWVSRYERGTVLGLVTGEREPMQVDLRIDEEPFNPTVRAAYGTRDLAPGASLTVRRFLLLHPGARADASALVQRLLGGRVGRVALHVLGARQEQLARLKPALIVTRAGKPVLRSRVTRLGTEVTLPAGHRYLAYLELPGAGKGAAHVVDLGIVGPKMPVVGLPLPPHGFLAYEATSADGKPLPVRLTFQGLGKTPTPELGDDGTVEGSLDVLYSRTGKGRRLLAPGQYRVAVTRGLEYERQVSELRVIAGKTTPLRVQLARVVQTPGALSADLHLHASPSMDSDLSLRGRLIQLAAEGVEYAVATDHNAITDYGPAARAARLDPWIATVVGCEITTRRASWGHFNIFPLRPGAPVPPYANVTPREMFQRWRALPSRPVIQVNHPRMYSIGYFNQVAFDRRHGRAFTRAFATDFDALEVFNGDYVYQPQLVERNLRDWYALLNLGHRFTATGNSDAHKLGYQEAGYPRNYLLVGPGRDHPAGLTARAAEEAILKQRVVVSSGPYISLTRAAAAGAAADKPAQSVIGRQLRATTPVALELTVQAPCWVPVTSVEIVANGKTHSRFELAQPPGRRLPSAGAGARPRCDPIRLKKTLQLKPVRDTWYVVVARSREPLPVLRRRATAVFGFTNPVYLDADGDGQFAPLGVPTPPPTR
ncbi:MAG: CehA/McbA family metallohydrolase [bacterium]